MATIISPPSSHPQRPLLGVALVMLAVIAFALSDAVTKYLASWLGSAVGFAGVLFMVRRGSGLDTWGVTFALINATLSTAYHLLTRLLVRTETTAALLFQTSLVGTVVFGAITLTLPALRPPPVNYLHLVWAGGLGWVAFDHIPDAWSLLGMALICCAGVWVALHAHFVKAARATAKTPG